MIAPMAEVAGRDVILDGALERFLAKGWHVDDRTESAAVISKEWGPGYLLFGLRGLLPDREQRPPERMFKRRLVTVDRVGKVDVKRLPSRGDDASRYERG
jgi:hypothetical protein